MTEIEKYEQQPRIQDGDIIQHFKVYNDFGSYRCWLYTCITIICMLSTMSGMNFMFNIASIPFLCYPPNFNASTIPANLTENEYLEMLQPDDDQCSVYNNSFIGTYYATPPSNSSKLQCSYGRKFLTEKFSSVVSEFDLVCERKWLKPTLQSVYFSGYLVGSIVFGVLSDRFGRRHIILLTNTLLVVCGITKIFVPSVIGFAILYSIQASGYIGLVLTTYALAVEFSSLKLRVTINSWFFGGVQLGALFLPGFAYALPDWHCLELALCLLPVINFFISIFLPESPRWLIGKNRLSEAKVILQKVMNKEETLCKKTLCKKTLCTQTSSENPRNKMNYTFIDLLKFPKLLSSTKYICFNWMVIGILYDVLTLSFIDVTGNRYINVFIMMATMFTCPLCSYYVFTLFDHRKSTIFFVIFSGISCILSTIVTKDSFRIATILVVLETFGITVAFISLHLLSAEIFPTVVRMNGLGMASMSAHIGSICTPFILHLSSFVKWSPVTVFGILSVPVGLLLILLPETTEKHLPDTFEDFKTESNNFR